MLKPTDKTVLLLTPDKFEGIGYVTCASILRRAKIVVTLVGEFSGFKNVLSDQHLEVHTEVALKQIFIERPYLLPFDAVIVPGGKEEDVLEQKLAVLTIKKHFMKKKILGLLGQAPRHLHKLGIGIWRNITGYRKAFENLNHNFEYTGETTVVHGNLVTSRSPATAVEFALTIVEMLTNLTHAIHIAEEIEFKYISKVPKSQ